MNTHPSGVDIHRLQPTGARALGGEGWKAKLCTSKSVVLCDVIGLGLALYSTSTTKLLQTFSAFTLSTYRKYRIALYHRWSRPGKFFNLSPPANGVFFPHIFLFLTYLFGIRSLTDIPDHACGKEGREGRKEGRKEGFLLEVQFYENGKGYYSVY